MSDHDHTGSAGSVLTELSNEHAGLYLHIPFCTSVCPYCDFAVLIGYQQRRASFLASLLTEIELQHGSPLCFDTIYLGGGTPSSMTIDQLGEILNAIRQGLVTTPDARLYLEANPEDITRHSLRAWRALGFRTISIGIQSLDEQVLVRLGRKHSATQARRSVELARAAGFETVSIDLIYGYAGHDPSSWHQQLQQAIELGPDHLSCYQLTLHRGTVFGRRRRRRELAELPEPVQAELFLRTHQLLNDSGFQGYEVSNFAVAAEHRSQHNCKYWNHTPYLGLGPAAHSFADNRRWWHLRKLRQYQNALTAGRLPIAGEEQLSPTELAFEAVMLGFRTYAGVDTEMIRRCYGIDIVTAGCEVIERLTRSGLLVRHGSRLVPTLAGLAVADTLACELAP